ncbi:MAG: hypothetical protein ACNI28_11285 [Arcobacter sp.]|uniref:hypothetical protein n=1 Tax=Arcobacter sp. TaxID=1872629 RepID=UPI003B001E29
MKNYNHLTNNKIKFLDEKELIQNNIYQWKEELYMIYTMSSGTLLNHEVGLADEQMCKDTLEGVNKNIKELIIKLDNFKEYIYLSNINKEKEC